jgi:uncharacterized membrane protein (DUF2068 family)
VLTWLEICFKIHPMLALLIIVFGFLSRMVVHTPNFTPILSLALLGGMYLKGRQAVIVPLAMMVIGDFFTGFYGSEMFIVWGSIVLISILGTWLKERKSFFNVVSCSIFSAVAFFVVTNFGSWLVLYPHTIDGLRQCYILAIPFFRSTLVSTVAYSLVFYAGYEWVLKRSQGTVLARLV